MSDSRKNSGNEWSYNDEAVSELSHDMSHLELHWENQRLKHRILALEKRLREKSEEFIRMESAWRQEKAREELL